MLRDDISQSSSPSPNVYHLEWGATRGDGERGEDVTDVANAIDAIPQKLVFPWRSSQQLEKSTNSLPDIIEVRGEVVLPTSIFVELTSSKADDEEEENDVEGESESSSKQSGARALLPTQFSNARNAASGILVRRKSQSEMTPEEVDYTKKLRSYLRFYAYSIAFSPLLHYQVIERKVYGTKTKILVEI